MAAEFTTQGFQDLLSFPFSTSDARKKLLIAGLLGLASFVIPIIPSIFLIGYAGLIMRRMILDKAEASMPDWRDSSEMLSLGLKMFGAGFIYSSPIMTVFVLGYLGMVLPSFLMALSGPGTRQGMESLIGLQMLGMFGGMFVMAIGMLFLIALALVMPPMLGHVAATNSFAAAFRVREWWRILRVNFGGFVVATVLTAGIYMILLVAAQVLYMTLVFCILLPFVFAFIIAYLSVIGYAVYAQAYREAVARIASQPA